MDWKEFFAPTTGKLATAIALLLLAGAFFAMAASSQVMCKIGVECRQPARYTVGMIGASVLAWPILLAAKVIDSVQTVGHSVIAAGAVFIIAALLSLAYLYFLACAIVWLWTRRSSR